MNKFLREGTKNEYSGNFKHPLWTYDVWLAISYYLDYSNSIEVAAGLMQHPIYSPEIPKFMSYGSLGGYIAPILFEPIDVYGNLLRANIIIKFVSEALAIPNVLSLTYSFNW